MQQILSCAARAIRLIGDHIADDAAADDTDGAIARLTGCLVEFDALRTPESSSFFAALLRDARRQSVALRSQIRAAASAAATEIALMAAFTLLLRWAGPANYGIFVFAVSGLVVLLIAMTGVAPGGVIAARAQNTMIGGMLALAAYAVWPTWEKTQTRAALAEMLEAYREYTNAVLIAWQGGSRAAINGVRLKGRRARSNAQASVDRMLGEPGVTERQAVSLNAILVHSHSFVHAVMAMESHLYRTRRDPMPAWIPGFAASVDEALAALISRVRSAPAGAKRLKIDVEIPAPGTGGSEIAETEADRVRVSLRSLAEEISRGDWI